MYIRLGKSAEHEAVLALFRAVIAAAPADKKRWDLNHYPTPELLLGDLASSRMWALEGVENPAAHAISENGGLLGVAVIDFDEDVGFEDGDWRVPGKFAVFHRLCVHPSLQGQGVGKKLLALCEDKARDLGAVAVRFDVHANNDEAIGLYEHVGYRRAGKTEFYGIEFYLYEKAL